MVDVNKINITTQEGILINIHLVDNEERIYGEITYNLRRYRNKSIELKDELIKVLEGGVLVVNLYNSISSRMMDGILLNRVTNLDEEEKKLLVEFLDMLDLDNKRFEEDYNEK